MKKFLPAILVLIFFSCQKEINPENAAPDPNNPAATDSCRIKTAYYYGGSGGINDTANFIYNNGQLIKIEGTSDIINYTYTGNRVTKLEYYDAFDSSLYREDILTYLNDTMVSRLTTHEYDNFFGDTTHTTIDFSYTGSRLTSTLGVSTYAGVPDSDTSWNELIYTGDNITSIIMRSTVWADDTIHYSYDANPNYFRNLSPLFFLNDPLFMIHVGFEPHLPYFLSRNNVTNFRIYGNVDYPIEYQTDSLSHPTLVSVGGFEYMGYKYECP